LYYTPAHVETIFRRAKASGIDISRLMVMVLWFAASLRVERVHPLQGGIVRLKNRRERRPELPVESPLRFYLRLAMEFFGKNARILSEMRRMRGIARRVDRDPASRTYTDLAMTPVTDEDVENLAMFTHNQGARDAVVHARKIRTLTHAAE
ncbi:MAG TPA: hypothetical protein VLV55_04195, partial [Rhizomicrobium sp.]|nr:hypothetical protein [Rhizomicrobium sp.]